MEFIELKKPELSYPVGLHMDVNLATIIKMSDLIKKKYKYSKTISLWCRGSSGAIVAGIVASRLKNTKICHIKKPGENAHSDKSFAQGIVNIIIDDFICSGNTVSEIFAKYDEVSNGFPIDCLCVSGHVALKNLPFDPNTVIATTVSPMED